MKHIPNKYVDVNAVIPLILDASFHLSVSYELGVPVGVTQEERPKKTLDELCKSDCC